MNAELFHIFRRPKIQSRIYQCFYAAKAGRFSEVCSRFQQIQGFQRAGCWTWGSTIRLLQFWKNGRIPVSIRNFSENIPSLSFQKMVCPHLWRGRQICCQMDALWSEATRPLLGHNSLGRSKESWVFPGFPTKNPGEEAIKLTCRKYERLIFLLATNDSIIIYHNILL